MIGKLWILINGKESEVQAVLAGEALRKSAAAKGVAAQTSVLGQDGFITPLIGNPNPGDAVLTIGEVTPPASLAGLPRTKVDLLAALGNPEQTLEQAVNGGAAAGGSGGGAKKIVAITSCPTGIAHTFMAAEGLKKAAGELGYGIRVETQGSVGAGTPLTPQEISDADLVLIAADREVDRTRFNGKKVYAEGTKRAINDGKGLIGKAFSEAAVQAGAPGSGAADGPQMGKKVSPYRHLMTGVSYMLPFVVAGGLCIALAFAIGGINAEGTIAKALMMLGGQGGFALMVPVLAGYIAFSIADRPGLAPGMIGGILSNILGAGFLGGIIAGFLAGYIVAFLNRYIILPKTLTGLKPVLILPLLGTAITGLILYFVLGGPVAGINTHLIEWLRGLEGTNSILLGLIIGGMMAVDMGGPVNKAAYAFSVGMMEANLYLPLGAAMTAGMTPPLAAALATHLFKNRFTREERESSGAAFVLGLGFISEGAIPFAARDPFRVIPSFIVGSALAGAIAMATGLKFLAPHGGMFLLPIPGAISSIGGFFLALSVGTVVSALLIGFLKKPVEQA